MQLLYTHMFVECQIYVDIMTVEKLSSISLLFIGQFVHSVEERVWGKGEMVGSLF